MKLNLGKLLLPALNTYFQVAETQAELDSAVVGQEIRAKSIARGVRLRKRKVHFDLIAVVDE
jgi:hypothetical protein